MRRIVRILCVFAVIACLITAVNAASSASDVSLHATVNRDGSAQITLTATLHLDQAGDELKFPVPRDATGVTLNGDRVSTRKSNTVRYIDLARELKAISGDVSISVNYNLPDVIVATDTGLQLQLPLLSGFAYPIEDMSFTVTLPGTFDTLPAFSSGYHQTSIEKDLVYTVNGATISGGSLTELKDHETLSMFLSVTEELFPQTLADTQDYTFAIVGMIVCGVLGALYWLIALRSWPFRRERSVDPPQGYTAGEMGCVLHMQGVNLSLSVLSWAQLGYILIQPDRYGKVLLHKRMEMGNERKESEQKLFKLLFGKKNVVDTSGLRYAQLLRMAGKKPSGVRELLRRRTGNPLVLRGLFSGIGLFGGVCMAIAVSGGAFLQGVLILLLGVLGAISGWYIQLWGQCVLTFRKHRLLGTLAVAAVWLLLGAICGVFQIGLGMVAGLLAAGLLLTWAGLRTDIGKQSRAQVLGLRRYMCRGEKLLLQRLMNADPDYFFNLAPYALALGAGKSFARRFGNKRLTGCPYLSSGMDQHMTALEWMQVMEKTVETMERRARMLPVEKMLQLIQSLRK